MYFSLLNSFVEAVHTHLSMHTDMFLYRHMHTHVHALSFLNCRVVAATV